MVIGVTDTMGAEHKWQAYIDWLLGGNEQVKYKKLSYNIGNAESIQACDALVLTGGGDVDPLLYGGDPSHAKLDHVDRKRDDFERTVIDGALKSQIPLLGICRGLQVTNVHLGGSLVLDLEESGGLSHRNSAGAQSRHAVIIEKDSLLSKIARDKHVAVNSSHHQAVATIAPGLRVVATSQDGVIEALEFEDAGDYPFFLLVQWHPERMKDFENTLSQDMLYAFLSSIQLKEKIRREVKNTL